MAKKTIAAAILGAITTVLVLKVFIGAFIVDLIIRLINPIIETGVTEIAHIAFAALITAIMTTLILKGVIKLPKWLNGYN